MEVKTDKETTIQYFSFGNGNRDVVILPGLSVFPIANSREYVAQRYKKLADDFRITLIDRPLDPPQSYDIQTASKDIAAIMLKNKIKNAYIIGFSQGGMIAENLALNYPDMLAGLVLCASTLKVSNDTKEKISSWMDAAKNKNRELLAKSFVRDVYSENDAKKMENDAIKATLTIPDKLLERFVILAKSCLDFDILHSAHKIKCPTFVLASAADKVIALENSNLLVNSIKNSTLFVYDSSHNYGHAFIDEAEDIVEKIHQFLTSN